MNEETSFVSKEPGQSKIFSTSVRGWIALSLAICLCLSIGMIVVAPFVDVIMPEPVTNQLLVLFASGFGAAVNQYFNQLSKEGQKK